MERFLKVQQSQTLVHCWSSGNVKVGQSVQAAYMHLRTGGANVKQNYST